MNEANIRTEVFNLLERLWLWPITQTDARTPMSKEVFGLLYALEKAAPAQKPLIGALRGALARVNTPPIGRPDILVLNPVDASLVVEVKVFDKPRGSWAAASFDTNNITPEQRNWLDMWLDDYGKGYLALGTIHGRPNSSKEPRYLWLIPWHVYYLLEKQVIEAGVSTIPLVEVKGMRVALREAGLWATKMFDPYALVWDNGMWHLPRTHPLASLMKASGTLSCSQFQLNCNERDLSTWKAQWKGESND